jgi:hypothetical protein
MIARDEYTQLHVTDYGLMMLDQFDRGKSDTIRQDESALAWDCHLLLQLIQRRGPRSVVVDSMGYPAYYSLFLANHLTQGALTVFEPQPALFQLMAGTFALNSFSQVRCEPTQLGNPKEAGHQWGYLEESPVRLEINKKAVMFHQNPVQGPSGKGHQQVIPQIALDAYADTHQLKALDLWLVGSPVFSALQGGEQQIQTHHPALVWDLPWEPNDIYAIEAWLHERGYVVYGLKTPTQKHQAEKYQTEKYKTDTHRFIALFTGSPMYQDLAWRIALENYCYTTIEAIV